MWCSTVPESWINKSNNTLKWPPKTGTVTTLAKKLAKPKKDWQTVNYSRLLGPYETYDVARTVEIAAVDLSTSDEAAMSRLQDGQILTNKRNRKLTKHYRNEGNEESSTSEDEENEKQGNVSSITTPVFNFKDTGGIVEDTQELSYGDFFDSNPLNPTIVPNVEITEVQQSLGTDGNHANSETFSSVSAEHPSPTTGSDNNITITGGEILNLDCSPNCCAACSLKIDTLLRLVNQIIINQENINTINYSEPSRRASVHQNILPAFPLNDITQLEKFNILLKDNAAARSQYIDIINVRRDQDGKKHTRNVLSYIITDELGRPLSWTGQKNTIKVKDMEFVKVLIETIVQSNRGEVSNTNIESAVKSWLQHSGDRIDYRAGNKTKTK